MKSFKKFFDYNIQISSKIYFLFFVSCFFVVNTFINLSHDDYAYAFIWDGEHGGNLDGRTLSENFYPLERVDGLTDILKSQYSHYSTWGGGRSVAHFIAQFFIWVGKSYFDVANTIIFALLILAILKMANIYLKESKFILFWIFFNLFFVGEKFASTTLWMTWLTGACNYLWTTFFQIIFLLPYVMTIRRNKDDCSKSKIIIMIILGIFAGWSNEAGSLATMCLTAFFVAMLKTKKILSVSKIAGFVALMFGCFMNITAPGNYAQLEFIQSVNPAAYTYSKDFFLEHFQNGFVPLVAMDLFILLPTIFYFCKKDFAALSTNEILILSFMTAGFLIPFAMMFSPKFHLRIAVDSMAFMFVSSAMTYAEIKKLNLKISSCLKKTFRFANMFLVVYFLSTLFLCFTADKNIKKQLEYMEVHKKDYVIVMPKLPPLPKYLTKIHGNDFIGLQSYLGGICTNENYYLNIMISQYYGLNKIVAEH